MCVALLCFVVVGLFPYNSSFIIKTPTNCQTSPRPVGVLCGKFLASKLQTEVMSSNNVWNVRLLSLGIQVPSQKVIEDTM